MAKAKNPERWSRNTRNWSYQNEVRFNSPSNRFCERHIRLLRNSLKRYFWYFDILLSLEKLHKLAPPKFYEASEGTAAYNAIVEAEQGTEKSAEILKSIKFLFSKMYD